MKRLALIISCCGVLLISWSNGHASSPLQQDRLFDRVWAAYLPTLHRHFIDYLALDDATLDALSTSPKNTVRLFLRVDRHGRVQTVQVLSSTGLPAFTRACVDAARRMGRLPNLPAVVHDRGRREGIEFVFGTE